MFQCRPSFCLVFPSSLLFREGNDVFRCRFRGLSLVFPAGNGPHAQHQDEPCDKPGKSSHTSCSWEPRPVKIWMVSSIAATKNPQQKRCTTRWKLTLWNRASSPADSPPRQANSVKWASFRTKWTSCSWLGNRAFTKSGRKFSTPTLKSWDSAWLTRELPQMKAKLHSRRIDSKNAAVLRLSFIRALLSSVTEP